MDSILLVMILGRRKRPLDISSIEESCGIGNLPSYLSSWFLGPIRSLSPISRTAL